MTTEGFDPKRSLIEQAEATRATRASEAEAAKLVPGLTQRIKRFTQAALRNSESRGNLAASMTAKTLVKCEIPSGVSVEVAYTEDSAFDLQECAVSMNDLSEYLKISGSVAKIESKSHKYSGTVDFGPESSRKALMSDILQYTEFLDTVEKSDVQKTTSRFSVAPLMHP